MELVAQNAIDQIIGHAELKSQEKVMRQQLPLCRNGRFLPRRCRSRHMGKLIKNDRHRIDDTIDTQPTNAATPTTSDQNPAPAVH